jgi:hypothetical protein
MSIKVKVSYVTGPDRELCETLAQMARASLMSAATVPVRSLRQRQLLNSNIVSAPLVPDIWI